MKNKVYKYKILQYRNGHGEDVFMCQYKNILGIYCYITENFCLSTYNVSWSSYSGVIEHIEKWIEKKREKLKAEGHFKQTRKLTFIAESKKEYTLFK